MMNYSPPPANDASFLHKVIFHGEFRDAQFPPEAKGTVAFIHLISGLLQLKFADENPIDMQSGMLAVFSPELQIPKLSGSHFCYRILCLSGGTTHAIAKEDTLPVCFIPDNPEILSILDDIFRSSESGYYPVSFVSEHIYHLLTLTYDHAISENSNSFYYDLTIECIKYLNEHMYESFSLTDCSKKLHHGKSYLSRFFSANTGMTLTDYHTMLRIKESKKLLKTTPDKIADISARLGFTDTSHFTKQFKKSEGITPAKYRKQAKQKT